MTDTRRSTLGDRLDEVNRERGLSDRAWSLAAGQSDKYLAVQRSRAADSPTFVLPEKRADALARVAKVRTEWLRFGTGSRDLDAPSPAQQLPRVLELALFDVYPRTCVSAEDAVTARELARKMLDVIPSDREAAGAALERLLLAVARFRREGRTATVEALAGAFLLGPNAPQQAPTPNVTPAPAPTAQGAFSPSASLDKGSPKVASGSSRKH